MKRCLELAEKGRYHVRSNPMVGCVIVKDDKIISEGYHEYYGGNHAERNAILKLSDKELLKGSTLYVNLEPCSHHGKTPPCADLILESGIPHVVVGMQDPNPKVAGSGLQRLRDAGVLVQTDILNDECRDLNKHFVCYFEKKRPFITLKWARTRDGFMGRPDPKDGDRQISNAASSRYVHKLRAEHNAILIGARTANTDDPLLNVRHWDGADPVKVILSPLGSLRTDLQLFEQGNTRVYTSSDHTYPGTTVHLDPMNFISDMLDDLYEQGLNSVLIEGGRSILDAFLEAGMWNEIHEIIGQKDWKTGVEAPLITMEPTTQIKLSGDQINVYKNEF